MSTGVLRAFVVTLLCSVAARGAGLHAQAAPTFTDSQATRGERWFAATCQSCHPVRDMSSPDFQVRWGGRSAFDLFDRISTTMPQAEPGSLSRRAYTDIVTYLMRINGIAPGTVPLAADSVALTSVRLAFATHSPAPRLR